MQHNFISGILKAPQSQDITHTGLPTLDEIIQGPSKKKKNTHTQTKHELFSKSILGYLCNTFCTHDLSFTQIKHKHAHTSAQTLSKHVISINFFDLQIYIHHLNKTSLIVISKSYINFCD